MIKQFIDRDNVLEILRTKTINTIFDYVAQLPTREIVIEPENRLEAYRHICWGNIFNSGYMELCWDKKVIIDLNKDRTYMQKPHYNYRPIVKFVELMPDEKIIKKLKKED